MSLYSHASGIAHHSHFATDGPQFVKANNMFTACQETQKLICNNHVRLCIISFGKELGVVKEPLLLEDSETRQTSHSMAVACPEMQILNPKQ